MLQAQSAVWTAEAARVLADRYRQVLRIVVAVEVAAGMLLLARPLARLLSLGLLALAGFSRGGRAHPGADRWPNWAGIAARASLGASCFLAAGGTVWLGLWFSGAAFALLAAYARALRAELMANP